MTECNDKKEETCHSMERSEGNVYMNFDDIILNYPVPFEQTCAGKEILKRLGHGSCCCCCCKEEKASGGNTGTESALSITLDATWDLKLNVGDAYAPSSVLIIEIGAEFTWNASGDQGTTVDIQATTLNLKGESSHPFPTWTDIITDQRPVGVNRWHMVNGIIGNTIRFQAVAKDQNGNVAYSNVISVSPGSPSL